MCGWNCIVDTHIRYSVTRRCEDTLVIVTHCSHFPLVCARRPQRLRRVVEPAALLPTPEPTTVLALLLVQLERVAMLMVALEAPPGGAALP